MIYKFLPGFFSVALLQKHLFDIYLNRVVFRIFINWNLFLKKLKHKHIQNKSS